MYNLPLVRVHSTHFQETCHYRTSLTSPPMRRAGAISSSGNTRGLPSLKAPFRCCLTFVNVKKKTRGQPTGLFYFSLIQLLRIALGRKTQRKRYIIGNQLVFSRTDKI